MKGTKVLEELEAEHRAVIENWKRAKF